jgi:hypothetical protein
MRQRRTDEWTYIQDDALIKFWTKGLSASEISKDHGKDIGHRSRSAIFGRIHRLKLGRAKDRLPGHRNKHKGESMTPEDCFVPEGIDESLDELARAG